MVGTSGQVAIRCGLAIANARTLPLSASGLAWAQNANAPCTPLAVTLRAASPEPLNGTPAIAVLASALSCASAMAGDVAGPDVPKLILFGLALASASNSSSVL